MRRDWCELSARMGNYVLDEVCLIHFVEEFFHNFFKILSGKTREEVIENIHNYLHKV